MMGQHLQRLNTFLLAMIAELVPQNELVARFVRPLVELEVAAAIWLVNTPASQDLCQFRHIFLVITAVHAQRVQFHHFTRVILIQTTAVLCRTGLHRETTAITITPHTLPAGTVE